MPDKGFSLIELLTVIAIVSILLAIIVSVTSAVKGKVKNISCASNLRNIGEAALMFSQENDGFLVVGSTGTTNPEFPTNLAWFHLLRPYFQWGEAGRQNAGTAFMPWLVCPGDPAEGGRSISRTHIERRSYAVNRNVMEYRLAKGYWPRLQDIQRPSEVIYFSDHDHEGTGSKTWSNAELVSASNELPLWHGGKINCLMIDGSVRLIEIEKLIPGAQNADLWLLEPWAANSTE